MQRSHDTCNRAYPAVSIRELRKSHGGRVVVDGLSLDIRSGEVVGLIGANGAGKTTTVEILQGLRRADHGHIRVLGLDPARDAPVMVNFIDPAEVNA